MRSPEACLCIGRWPGHIHGLTIYPSVITYRPAKDPLPGLIYHKGRTAPTVGSPWRCPFGLILRHFNVLMAFKTELVEVRESEWLVDLWLCICLWLNVSLKALDTRSFATHQPEGARERSEDSCHQTRPLLLCHVPANQWFRPPHYLVLVCFAGLVWPCDSSFELFPLLGDCLLKLRK